MFDVVNQKSLLAGNSVHSNICLLCDTHDNNCSVCNEGVLDFIHCDNAADK